MHVILTAVGSKGDVFPFLGFGRYLVQQGHTVALITSGNYRADVAEAGLEFIEFYDAATHELITRELERLDNSRERFSRIDPQILELCLSLAPERLYSLIEQHHVSGNTVVATTELYTFGAANMAHEKLGIPFASLWHNLLLFRLAQPTLPGPFALLEDLVRNSLLLCVRETRKVRARVDALRRRLKLPPVRNFIRDVLYSPQLNIGLFPPWFAAWFPGRLPNTLLTDFPLYERNLDSGLPTHLDEFLKRGAPPVVFGNASWRSNLDEYFEASAAACRELGLRGILLSERARRFPGLDDSLVAVDYASLKSLLPRAAAIVHHGGIGTIARSLAAGIPQLIVPWNVDQPYNARQVRRLGTGLVVSPRRYPRQAQPLLQKLLDSPQIRRRCGELAERFQGEADFSAACLRLEQLLADSRSRTVSARGTR